MAKCDGGRLNRIRSNKRKCRHCGERFDRARDINGYFVAIANMLESGNPDAQKLGYVETALDLAWHALDSVCLACRASLVIDALKEGQS